MASVNDKFTDVRNAARPNTARVSTARTVGATNLACDSLTGWPTASKVHFVTYQIDTNNDPIPGSQLDCYGIVSGSTITSMAVVDGTDGGNSVGDVVEMLPTSAWGQDLADGLTYAHERTGAHKSGAVYPSPSITGSVTGGATYASPILTTPTIADLTNMNHTHASTAQGGTLGSSAITGIDKSITTTDSNPYKFSVYKSADQTGISDSVLTKITWDSEAFDTNGNFASDKYTAPVSGFYQINFYLRMTSANNTGYAAIGSLYKNGGEVSRRDGPLPNSGAGGSIYLPVYFSELVQLTAGDYLEVFGYMDVASSTVTVGGGSSSNSAKFSGYLVSRT